VFPEQLRACGYATTNLRDLSIGERRNLRENVDRNLLLFR
jgi:hypothetical protein